MCLGSDKTWKFPNVLTIFSDPQPPNCGFHLHRCFFSAWGNRCKANIVEFTRMLNDWERLWYWLSELWRSKRFRSGVSPSWKNHLLNPSEGESVKELFLVIFTPLYLSARIFWQKVPSARILSTTLLSIIWYPRRLGVPTENSGIRLVYWFYVVRARKFSAARSQLQKTTPHRCWDMYLL